MADGTETTTTTVDPAIAAAAAAAAAAKPWHEGKLDADLLGHAQNAGWKVDDPATLAAEAVKAHREARKFIGVPENQLLRLPTDAKDEAGWNSVWQRLGVPKDPKEYDFSAVKRADGTAIDEAFADTIRQTAATNRIPKDAATAFAQSVVKHIEQQEASQVAEAKAKWDSGIQRLKQNWGDRIKENEGVALTGARRLGFSQEEYNAMGEVLGPDRVGEMFRKIGAGTTEDTFIEGKGGTVPVTAAAAQARLDELGADKAWAKRLFDGDAAARREHDALIQQITGVAA